MNLLFDQQQRLSSSELISGWWARGWAETQDNYLRSLHQRTQGQRWLTQIIKRQLELSWDLWKHRMKIAHSEDSHTLTATHELLNLRIREMYTTHAHTDHSPLRRWFRAQVHTLDSQPLHFKQDWLNMVNSFLPFLPPEPQQDLMDR